MMSELNGLESGATVVITHRIDRANSMAYETWLAEIIPICKSYPGHLGTIVIRPNSDEVSTYTIVIRFDSEAHLRAWTTSEDRRRLLDKVKSLLLDDDKFSVSSGLDFWFTPEQVKAKIPKRWKQFLITWSAIYPLVVLISKLAGELIHKFSVPDNFYLRMLVITGLVVTMMVYVVMPRYTKLVHKWLFN